MANYTDRLGLILQAYSSNPETWGTELNEAVFKLLDEMVGVEEIAVHGDITLTWEDAVANQARHLFIPFSGAGGHTVTVKGVDRFYLVHNRCAADITIKPEDGIGSVIRAGATVLWYTDGSTGFTVGDLPLNRIKSPDADVSLNGNKIVGLAYPEDETDGSNKKYVDDLRAYVDNLAASSDLGTVASIADQIRTVAAIEDGTVADEAVSTVGSIAPQVVTVAGVSDAVAQLAGMFTGASTIDPVTRLDGSPLQAGDYYLNAAGTPNVRVYDGANWIPIEPVSFANQAQAEAGEATGIAMDPLRTAQAIAAQAGDVVLEVFTSSGTFTKQADDIAYFIELWGGGGGGNSGEAADSNNQFGRGGGSGGGGSYGMGFVPASQITGSVNVEIGAGGAGGVQSSPGGSFVVGGRGGDSSFGDFVFAPGGGTAVTSPEQRPAVLQGALAMPNNASSSALGGRGGIRYAGSSGGPGAHTGASSSGGRRAGGEGGSPLLDSGGGGISGSAGGGGGNPPGNGGDGDRFCGGGGGGSNGAIAAGNGGNGGVAGGGGGGGGVFSTLLVPGRGGDGGRGEVHVYRLKRIKQ